MNDATQAPKQIRLVVDIPVAEGHGLTKGRVLDVVEAHVAPGRGQTWFWVIGDAGERVKIWRCECEPVTAGGAA